jgi:hypothetical protein
MTTIRTYDDDTNAVQTCIIARTGDRRTAGNGFGKWLRRVGDK